MGHRYRWWYRMTGLPGWMRFGFSPGWLGYGNYGPGLRNFPSWAWLNPYMNYFRQASSVSQINEPVNSKFESAYDPYAAGAISSEQELGILREQADELEKELKHIRKRIEELEKE